MRTVCLKYGTDFAVDLCNALWSNGAVGATISSDSTVKIEGTASMKAVAFSGATGVIAYHATGTLNLSGYRGLQVWVYVDTPKVAGQFSIRICSDTFGAVALDTLSLPAIDSGGVWRTYFLPFKNAATLTAVQSIALLNIIGGDPFGTIYLDNVKAIQGVNVSTTYLKGFDDPDQLRMWPGILQSLADQSYRQVINSQARVISFRSAITTPKSDLAWISSIFNLAGDKRIAYAGEEIPIVWSNPRQPFTLDWASGTELGRVGNFEFDEISTWSTAPVSFA